MDLTIQFYCHLLQLILVTLPRPTITRFDFDRKEVVSEQKQKC